MTCNPWAPHPTSRMPTPPIIDPGTPQTRRTGNPTPATSRPGACIPRCIPRQLLTDPLGVIRTRRRMRRRHPHSRARGSRPHSSSVRRASWSPRMFHTPMLVCPHTRPLPTPRAVSTKRPLQSMPPEARTSLSTNRCRATPPQAHHPEPRPTRHQPTDRRTRHSRHGSRRIIPRHSGPPATTTTTTRARTLIHGGREIGKKVAGTARRDSSPTCSACSHELDWILILQLHRTV